MARHGPEDWTVDRAGTRTRRDGATVDLRVTVDLRANSLCIRPEAPKAGALIARRFDHDAAHVVAAVGTDAVRRDGGATLRAVLQAHGLDAVMSPAASAASVGMFSFGNSHGRFRRGGPVDRHPISSNLVVFRSANEPSYGTPGEGVKAGGGLAAGPLAASVGRPFWQWRSDSTARRNLRNLRTTVPLASKIPEGGTRLSSHGSS
jgi:hypothetical protein